MSLELHDRKCFFYTEQDQRPTETPTFQIKHMQGFEKISSLFRFDLDLVSVQDDVSATDLVGTAAVLRMPLHDGEERFFHGVIASLERRGSFGDEDTALIAYQAVVVPWFWTLQLTHDCRVFENKTVVQIADEIFGKYSYGDYEFPKEYQGEAMDYCVQYRESDFAFLSRLFEQWGLGYTFKHDEQKHQLLIFETSTSLNEVMGDDISVRFEGRDGSAEAGEVSEIVDRQEMPSAYYEIDDYRFKDPDYDYKSWDWAAQPIADINYEMFDYPGGYVTEVEDKTASRGTLFARFKKESSEAAARRAEGKSLSTMFAAGLHFTLDEHFSYENGKRFLLTEVLHVVEQTVGSEDEPTIYYNEFACLPDDIPFRPKQTTRKPVVVGTQSALVVGPNAGVEGESEEIHTDKYGRVRLLFHWNRHVTSERPDLCWARVQQSLAGNRWGAQFIPRVGQEVIVSFLEGDPDRPVVIGSLYNGKRMPPYELPANKTQSGWKTRSTKEGNDQNFNEIKFEDKKGEEQVVIHAEKDHTVSVENNRSMSIGGDESATIEGKEVRTINGDDGQKISVTKGDRAVIVGTGNDKVTVKTDQIVAIEGEQKTQADVAINFNTPLMRVFADDQFYLTSADTYSFGNLNQMEGDAGTVTINASSVTIAVGGSTIEVADGGVTVTASVIKLNS